MISVNLSFLSPCLLVICWNSFSTLHCICVSSAVSVLFSVDFHISCIPMKSVMNFRFCCFFIFDSVRCLIFYLNFSFIFPFFLHCLHSTFFFFFLLCYFDDSPAFIFFHFIFYVFLDEFYFFHSHMKKLTDV